ncbi:MAG: class I SAM-dependent methyltransferase, partial [Alphaproteobacteria bacterium]
MPKTDPVRAQYEDLPYPPRDPADEARRLIAGSPSHLDELNHYVFAGGRDFAAPFRALVAGGGTGDGAIMLAQQLADRGGPAEIVYLDLSAASRAIAEARAAARGLDNLRFHTGSLLDIARIAPGPYDYIDCCGVLHHLDDPAAGVEALASALAPDGGMGLMLYGALGRTGVYDMQAMLRGLAPADAGAEDNKTRIARARRLLDALPPTNRFRRNPFLSDHVGAGDAGLYDLLLHARDRAYRVPEIVDLLAGAGLAPTGFVEPARYDPATYLTAPALLKPLADKDWIERAAFAELLAGNMRTHAFYAVPTARVAVAVAQPDRDDAVPVLR